MSFLSFFRPSPGHSTLFKRDREGADERVVELVMFVFGPRDDESGDIRYGIRGHPTG